MFSDIKTWYQDLKVKLEVVTKEIDKEFAVFSDNYQEDMISVQEECTAILKFEELVKEEDLSQDDADTMELEGN